MYRKYFVYLDDGENVRKVAIAAISGDAARSWFAENRKDIIAVEDVTDEYHIDANRVRKALEVAGFDTSEIGWMCRALQEFEIIE